MSNENENLKKKQVDDEKIAKLLLINETSSLGMLSATEYGRLKSQDKEAHENIVKALMDHCKMLLEGTKLFLKDTNTIENKNINRNTNLATKSLVTGEVKYTKKEEDIFWSDMKSNLTKSRENVEVELRQIFHKKNDTRGEPLGIFSMI